MASHGVPRAAVQQQRNAQEQERELKEISEYKSLVDQITEKVTQCDFSPELLQQTAALLTKNPEYYTMWNTRRRIYTNEFDNLAESTAAGDISDTDRRAQILQIIQLDLQFLFPLLLKFPKCYWIWHHRLWLLEQSSILLQPEEARKIWEDELGLVGKMLARDSRNYHGWAYRRTVVENLETARLDGSSMARQEYDYTTKMIGNNLSNFSAWHNRTKLLVRMLNEESASSSERKAVLDSELKLIHDALFDPYDQSLWFYHQNMMCNFDPAWSSRSIAPDLSMDERIAYVAGERKFVKEVLEDADDCKWAYQALLECELIDGKLKGSISPQSKLEMKTLLEQLKHLDPLREGRWSDMESLVR